MRERIRAGPGQRREIQFTVSCCCHCFVMSDSFASGTMDCSPLDSSVHGIFLQEYLSRFPFPSPEDLSGPGMKTESPALAGRSFPTEPPGNPSFLLSCQFCCLLGFMVLDGDQLFPLWNTKKRSLYKTLSHFRNLCPITFNPGGTLRKLRVFCFFAPLS